MLVYRQLQDPLIKKIHKDLEMQENDRYELRNGVVYRKHNYGLLFFVPEAMVYNVIRSCHDDVGHVRLQKTFNLMIKTYWFPSMRIRAKEYIENCLKCLSYSIPSKS